MAAAGSGSTYDSSKDGERSAACAFVREAGMKLRLPQLTIATAIVFFHRVFCRYTFAEFDKYLIGSTCLFLAAKAEDTLMKLKDLVCVSHVVRHKRQIRSEKELDSMKAKLLEYERVVLQAIGFEFAVEHPYRHLLRFVKLFEGSNDVAQYAWYFVNDSLRTTLCLQYTPKIIAAATLYLASQYVAKPLAKVDGKEWWEVVGANKDDLEAISNQILDVYDGSDTGGINGLKASMVQSPARHSAVKSTTSAKSAKPRPPPSA